MFERFTDRARRVVVIAQEEARLLNHNYIGTEHILLGLIGEGDGLGAQALSSLGISLGAVRHRVEEIIGRGGSAESGHIPFTPRAKKVLELSLREALQLGHNYIGTEHILLGLIREGEGVAAQVLVQLGADLSRVRQQVIQLLSGYSRPESGAGDPIHAADADTGWSVSAPSGGRTLRFPSEGPLPRLGLVGCALCGRRAPVAGAMVSSTTGVTVCQRCVTEAADLLASIGYVADVDDPPQLWVFDTGSRRAVSALSGEVARAAADEVRLAVAALNQVSADGEDADSVYPGRGLGPFIRRAAERTGAVGPACFELFTIEFVTPVLAFVTFHVTLAGGLASDNVGWAMRTADGWKITRETVVDLLAQAGVQVPPE